MNVDGEEYYMADYDYVSKLCYLLPDKKDTLQRLYKRIENVGLIKIIKIGKHLYINPSDDMRDWGNQFDNIESDTTEINPDYTEKNPKTTEKNPCSIYNISNNKEEINNKEEVLIENKFSLAAELSITAKDINVDTRVFKKVDDLLSNVVFPFDDLEFKKKFFVLCCMPKWRTKTIHAIQMQLNKLHDYELAFVMELIDNSIMNEWQGIVYQDTPKRYQEWLRSSNSHSIGGIRPITDPEEIEKIKQYLDKDSDLWK